MARINGSHIHYFDDSGRPLAQRLEGPRERYRLRSGGKVATEAWIPAKEFKDLYGDVTEVTVAGLVIRPEDNLDPGYIAVGQPAAAVEREADPPKGKPIEERVTEYPIKEDPADKDPLDVDPLDAADIEIPPLTSPVKLAEAERVTVVVDDPGSPRDREVLYDGPPPGEAANLEEVETVDAVEIAKIEETGGGKGKDPLYGDRMAPVNLKLSPEDVAYLKAEAEALDPNKDGVTLYADKPTASSLLRLIIEAAFAHVMGGGTLPEDPGPAAPVDIARMSYTLPDGILNDARTLGGDGGYMPGIRMALEAYRQGVIKV